MIDRELAAAVAFAALGANLIGTVVLLLVNAGSRSVRWYLPFQGAVLVWLLAQASYQLWPGEFWNALDAFAATLLPLLFLLFAVMETSRRPSWHGIVMLALAAPLLPVVMRGLYEHENTYVHGLMWVWFLGGWMGGPVILWLRGRREARRAPAHPQMRRKLILLALLLIAPVSIVGAMITEGPGFVLYVIPLMTIVVQFLIFYGVTRMQLYDIEVRVRRSGELAASTVETERLAVLGELAATIAHEVRNPLTGVRSLAQRIAQDEIPSDKRRRYAGIILEETGRVERLVNNLLEVARRRSTNNDGSLAPTPLATLFDDLALLVAARADRASVRVLTRADQIVVAAPRPMLAQLLLNLLLNAIAHAPEHTTVELAATHTATGTEISVQDRGAGIPASERERIFEPFYTTTPTGTGLGLSVVRHIAHTQGWLLAIHDAPGGGTIFTVAVPAATPAASA